MVAGNGAIVVAVEAKAAAVAADGIGVVVEPVKRLPRLKKLSEPQLLTKNDVGEGANVMAELHC